MTSENAGGQQGTDLKIHNIFGPSPETNCPLRLSRSFQEYPGNCVSHNSANATPHEDIPVDYIIVHQSSLQ